MDDALKQSEIILQEVESIRHYVISSIRPKAYELTGDDAFVIELMSTTYISLKVMEHFKEQMDGYAYRRVSLNPRNEKNRADEYEEEMAEWFNEDRDRTFWQGMVEKDDGKYFVSMVPDYISKGCLYCHGDPEDAPAELLERYGRENGFRFKLGDLAGINSVSIPIGNPINRLYGITAVMFLLSFGASLCLLGVLNVLFDKLVVTKILKVVDTVEKQGGQKREPEETKQSQPDELDTLRDTFFQLSRYVQTARKGSRQMANFVGSYTIEKPLVAGTLSWVYKGAHSQTGEGVILKVPFDNISENSIYRTFYRNETKILRNCNHDTLLKISGAISNVLISNPLDTYMSFSEPLSPSLNEKILFSHIFRLVSYLHTQGIVHHDLRPEIFLITRESTPILVDAGIAWWHKTPDQLHYSGLGPQGNVAYMAPEQLEGVRGDSRSDIYSLGVWLYSYFTGELPFQVEAVMNADLIKMKRQFVLSATISEQVGMDVSTILEKALHPDPDKRYQWVEDLRDDIVSFL